MLRLMHDVCYSKTLCNCRQCADNNPLSPCNKHIAPLMAVNNCSARYRLQHLAYNTLYFWSLLWVISLFVYREEVWSELYLNLAVLCRYWLYSVADEMIDPPISYEWATGRTVVTELIAPCLKYYIALNVFDSDSISYFNLTSLNLCFIFRPPYTVWMC